MSDDVTIVLWWRFFGGVSCVSTRLVYATYRQMAGPAGLS
jgi:hypothetical protein